MDRRLSSYTGCLLGLAAGDAFGYGVDELTLAGIREKFGPGGQLNYTLVNGYAETTSYTQLAAFACNGLLRGLTRGQMTGSMDPFVRYIAVGEADWARLQSYRREPEEKIHCWIGKFDVMRARRCMDTMTLDTARHRKTGTMEEPVNRFHGPSALTVAVPVGLFFNPERIGHDEVLRLGAEAVAITHGSPLAFLPGAALAHIISRITWDRVTDLNQLVWETAAVLEERFGREYPQAEHIARKLRFTSGLAESLDVSECDAMEQLGCGDGVGVLAGAVYACLCHPRNFDEAMITAVNHSGRSAAVGAVAGAIMGARLGVAGLPDQYMEPLDAGEVLVELARDMHQGCPMDIEQRLFDMEWDGKYVD